MPFVKIIKKYESTEHYSPGDVVDISNPWSLINEGKAVLVSSDGEEIEHPDVIKQLRRLVRTTKAIKLIGQLIATHPEKDKIVEELVAEGVVIEPPKLDEKVLPAISFDESIMRPVENEKMDDDLKRKIEEIKIKSK